MTIRTLALAVISFAILGTASAQAASDHDAALRASFAAHEHDFDYLLGDWAFTARNRSAGNFQGVWAAQRMPGGQILDEFRIVNRSGTSHSSFTLRAYNAVLERWEIVALNKVVGLGNFGTAHRVGSEMVGEQKVGSEDANPMIWHIRYHDISANHFLWDADQSADGGKSWDRDFMRIEARRIGPPRDFRSLTMCDCAGDPAKTKQSCASCLPNVQNAKSAPRKCAGSGCRKKA